MNELRTNLIVCIIIALSLILCPVVAVGSEKNTDITEGQATENAEKSYDESGGYIAVMSASTGDVEKIKLREYIIGSVAAEADAVYHSEALKAQAVASYTYAKKTREQNEKHKDSSLKNADISDSPDVHQGYINKEQRKEKWGEKFEEYENKISSAVDEVFGYYLTYNGETALTVYHSVSAGKTHDAKSMWGSEIPYLSSVASPGDKLSPDYTEKKCFKESEFKKLAEECGITLGGDASEWVGELTESDSGYVMSVRLGSTEISSSIFRETFGLKSLCFDINYSDEKFVIKTYGHGHGVGMSQYGADYMARQGSTWQEILEHYYVGTETEKDNSFDFG